MERRRLGAPDLDVLWELQMLYKAEIGEDAPEDGAKERLAAAIGEGRILFFGVWDAGALLGCCSVTVGFSSFDYRPSGVFEDFYIRPAWRRRGLAKKLAAFAWAESGVSTLTVGCADCDLGMYWALGFTLELGNLLAMTRAPDADREGDHAV